MPSEQAMRAAAWTIPAELGWDKELRAQIATRIDRETALPALLSVAAAARAWKEAVDARTDGYAEGASADEMNAAWDAAMERLGRIDAAEASLRAALEALPPANAKEKR